MHNFVTYYEMTLLNSYVASMLHLIFISSNSEAKLLSDYSVYFTLFASRDKSTTEITKRMKKGNLLCAFWRHNPAIYLAQFREISGGEDLVNSEVIWTDLIQYESLASKLLNVNDIPIGFSIVKTKQLSQMAQ